MENPILNQMFGTLMVLLSLIQIFNVVMPNCMESIINGAVLGAVGMSLLQKFLQWNLIYFEVILLSTSSGFFLAVLFAILSFYVKNIGEFLSKCIVCYIAIVFIVEYGISTSYVSLPLQVIAAFLCSVGLMWIKMTFSVICGGFFLVLGLSSILKRSLHKVLLNNFEVLTAPSLGPHDSFIVKENYINYSLNLNAIDYVLLIFCITIIIVITIRKENYYKNHPEAFSQTINIFSRLNQTSVDHNKNNARRRSRKRNGTDLPNTGERYRKIDHSGRVHYFYRTASGRGNPLISHWAQDESEGSDEVFESPQSNARFMRRVSIDPIYPTSCMPSTSKNLDVPH